MRYQVPQFVEVEDKIFGSLTLKQFVYVAGGAGLAFVIYKFFPVYLAYPLMGAVVGLAIALAFVQINKRPFVAIMESAFMFMFHSKLYLWQQDYARKKAAKKRKSDEEDAADEAAEVIIPNLTANKLKTLSWSLDINERIASDRERVKVQSTVDREPLDRITQMRKDALLPHN